MVYRPMVSGLVLFLLPVLAVPASASLFPYRSETPVPYSPVSLTTGDLDRDGDIDLVVCSQPGRVTVLLNDGFGRFKPAPGSPITNIPYLISAAIGSFNPQQDQFPDLVVMSGLLELKTGWLLLGDGTGRFRLQTSFTVGNGNNAAAADFNDDGYDDVAFDSGQVFLGSGFALIRGTDLPARSPGSQVLARDFDGDGHPDVAFVHHVLLSIPGTGSFIEAPGSPLEFGNGTYTVAAADFDGDGDLDLAVADMLVIGGPHPVSGADVLLNQGGGRMVHAGFEPVRTPYSAGIATADFDGDGHDDLAVGTIAEGNEISLLLGDGAGAFNQIDETLRVAGAGPSSIVAANLDRDGKPDLATIDPWSDAVDVFLHAAPPPIVEVSIDVLPGSDDNVIRLGSQGNLPVAILSTENFDATTVDPASVRLAGAPARVDPKGDPACQPEDVNRDHRVDLLCKVDKTALQLHAGDTVAVLTATTFGGTALQGQDTVRVLEGQAPHLPSTTLWPVGVSPVP